jgi:hypothetical protein
MPLYRTPISEPNGYGTQVTRIADQTAFGSASLDIRHHYAKNQPWNFDGTRAMLSSSSHPMLDGNDYSIVRTTNTFTPSFTRWSSVDSNTLYKLDGIAGVTDFRRYTISPNNTTQTYTILETFPDYKDMSIGPSEGNLSIGDRYVAIAARKKTGSPNGDADLWVLVYDIQNDVVKSVTPFYNKYADLDWVSMSQSGNYVVFNWRVATSVSTGGAEVFTLPAVNGDPLDFHLLLTAQKPHADMGYDAAGNEVYVAAEFDPAYSSTVAISTYRLDNGARTTQLTPGGGGSPFRPGHVSCRNYKRPGWAYITLNTNNTIPPLNPAQTMKEVFALRLDGSGTVERFAWTYNNKFDYNSETQGVPNPDGTKIMFASNWGGTDVNSQVYSYVAEWAQVPASNTYQAEDATLIGGGTIESNHGGYNGTGFVNYAVTSSVQFSNVAGLSGGNKTLTIRYSNGSGVSRPGQVVVNGGSAVSVNALNTGAFSTWTTIVLPITLNNNSTNTITISSTGSDFGNIDQITISNGQPVFTTQPSSQTVTAGANVSFTVAATGSPAPTYQWQKNGVNISGATSATLSLTNVQTANVGSYLAIATNSSGVTSSNAATLTVNNPPSITTQPSSQTVTAGSNVTFTVVAAGTPMLTYQWKKNGTNISGATSASLILTNVQTTNNGSYTVVVTNAVGSATSSTATLTVNNLTYQAENATLSGGNVTESYNLGWNGTGYVNPSTTGGSILFSNVNGQGGGTKMLVVRYALGKPDRTGQLAVNGGTPVSLLTADTGSFTTWVTISVPITLNNNSTNTIALNTNGSDLGNIDEITIQ